MSVYNEDIPGSTTTISAEAVEIPQIMHVRGYRLRNGMSQPLDGSLLFSTATNFVRGDSHAWSVARHTRDLGWRSSR